MGENKFVLIFIIETKKESPKEEDWLFLKLVTGPGYSDDMGRLSWIILDFLS